MQVSTIGLDLAKHVFQAHGVDADGNVALRRRLRRAEVVVFFSRLAPCLVGIEACATAHYWARELAALGHTVRLIPPSYVKPYVRRGKNDAADAEAICEAVARPSMRFVPIKSADQQAVLMLHKTRELLIKQRTMLINALRCHLAEFGIVAAQRRTGLGHLIAVVQDETDSRVPVLARRALEPLLAQLQHVQAAVSQLEAEIVAWHKSNEVSKRLATIPGIGPIIASAIAATMLDPSHFRSGREFAAWLGLVPKQNSSGGKERLGRISRQGNRYVRRLLVTGATAVIRYARTKAPGGDWLRALLARKPARLASVALANKMARTAWALLVRQEDYRATDARMSDATAAAAT
jgi:transposase